MLGNFLHTPSLGIVFASQLLRVVNCESRSIFVRLCYLLNFTAQLNLQFVPDLVYLFTLIWFVCHCTLLLRIRFIALGNVCKVILIKVQQLFTFNHIEGKISC